MNLLRSPVRKWWLHGRNTRTIPSESEQRLVRGYPSPASSHHETAVMVCLTFSVTDIWGELYFSATPIQACDNLNTKLYTYIVLKQLN